MVRNDTHQTHTHTLRKKLPNAKPLQAYGALGSSASHQAIKNNEGDIVMWLGAFGKKNRHSESRKIDTHTHPHTRYAHIQIQKGFQVDAQKSTACHSSVPDGEFFSSGSLEGRELTHSLHGVHTAHATPRCAATKPLKAWGYKRSARE